MRIKLVRVIVIVLFFPARIYSEETLSLISAWIKISNRIGLPVKSRPFSRYYFYDADTANHRIKDRMSKAVIQFIFLVLNIVVLTIIGSMLYYFKNVFRYSANSWHFVDMTVLENGLKDGTDREDTVREDAKGEEFYPVNNEWMVSFTNVCIESNKIGYNEIVVYIQQHNNNNNNTVFPWLPVRYTNTTLSRDKITDTLAYFIGVMYPQNVYHFMDTFFNKRSRAALGNKPSPWKPRK